MKSNKTFLFDLDGTLINTDRLIIESYNHLFATYRPDYKLTKKEVMSFLGPTLAEIFPQYFKEDFNTLLKTYRDFSNAHLKEYASTYEGVKELLDYLLGKVKLGIVTNRFKDSALEVLDAFELTKYFDVVISLDDVDNPKPHEEGIEKAMEYLSALKADTIYIGDNASDYQAAVNAKVKSALVSFPGGRNNTSLNPDIVIQSYQGFLKRIKDEQI